MSQRFLPKHHLPVQYPLSTALPLEQPLPSTMAKLGVCRRRKKRVWDIPPDCDVNPQSPEIIYYLQPPGSYTLQVVVCMENVMKAIEAESMQRLGQTAEDEKPLQQQQPKLSLGTLDVFYQIEVVAQADGRSGFTIPARFFLGRTYQVLDNVPPQALKWFSRRHCCVCWRYENLRLGEAVFTVVDLGSANGTYVNGRVLPPAGSLALQSGDLIGVSMTEAGEPMLGFRFVANSIASRVRGLDLIPQRSQTSRTNTDNHNNEDPLALSSSTASSSSLDCDCYDCRTECSSYTSSSDSIQGTMMMMMMNAQTIYRSDPSAAAAINRPFKTGWSDNIGTCKSAAATTTESLTLPAAAVTDTESLELPATLKQPNLIKRLLEIVHSGSTTTAGESTSLYNDKNKQHRENNNKETETHVLHTATHATTDQPDKLELHPNSGNKAKQAPAPDESVLGSRKSHSGLERKNSESVDSDDNSRGKLEKSQTHDKLVKSIDDSSQPPSCTVVPTSLTVVPQSSTAVPKRADRQWLVWKKTSRRLRTSPDLPNLESSSINTDGTNNVNNNLNHFSKDNNKLAVDPSAANTGSGCAQLNSQEHSNIKPRFYMRRRPMKAKVTEEGQIDHISSTGSSSSTHTPALISSSFSNYALFRHNHHRPSRKTIKLLSRARTARHRLRHKTSDASVSPTTSDNNTSSSSGDNSQKQQKPPVAQRRKKQHATFGIHSATKRLTRRKTLSKTVECDGLDLATDHSGGLSEASTRTSLPGNNNVWGCSMRQNWRPENNNNLNMIISREASTRRRSSIEGKDNNRVNNSNSNMTPIPRASSQTIITRHSTTEDCCAGDDIPQLPVAASESASSSYPHLMRRSAPLLPAGRNQRSQSGCLSAAARDAETSYKRRRTPQCESPAASTCLNTSIVRGGSCSALTTSPSESATDAPTDVPTSSGRFLQGVVRRLGSHISGRRKSLPEAF